MSQMTASHPEDWVDSHGDALFRFALIRVRKTEVAEDLVQETFLAALKDRSPYASGSAQLTWLTGILRHKIADHFRKKAREASFADLGFCEGEFGEKFQNGFWNHDLGPKDWGQDPAAAVESGEFLQTLDNCLHKLPERVAAVFNLSEMDETPSREVCTILCISESNLWTMLHRARMALRECLEKNWFAET
jgi:RNA polymerase sigma-70 factor (ECF subfamily)